MLTYQASTPAHIASPTSEMRTTAAPVEPVGDVAGDEHEQRRGSELGQPDEAEVELAAGRVEHELPERDGLHDRARVRQRDQRRGAP